MATTITAGNATDGLKITPDNTGILELKTGTGAGTTALTLNASQNATLAGTLTVGSTLQVAGVTTNMYPIVSGTAQTAPFAAPNTSANFTGIPSWAKRITVIFRNVSLSATASLLVQAGVNGTATTTGYSSITTFVVGGTSSGQLTSTSGFVIQSGDPNYQMFGHLVFTNVSGNTWVVSGVQGNVTGTAFSVTSSGTIALGGVLDMIRVTTTNGTDTFDVGTINLFWE